METNANEPDCLDEAPCRWVWEITGRRWLAEGSEVALIGLRILLILILALLLRWVVHRTITRLVRRIATPRVPVLLRPLPEKLRNTVQQSTSVQPTRRQQRAEAIGSVLRSAATVAIFTMAGLLILSELRINLAPLLAGAGIAGVALGFGAQSLVRDFLAGLFILLEDQYGVGDIVDLGEAAGVVVTMGLRATTLRDLQGVIWHVPNGEIRRVANRSHTPAGVVVDIPIGFAPVPQAAEALRRGAQRLTEDPEFREDLVEPPELLGVENVTVEGAVYRTLVKSTAESQWRVGRALRRFQTEALEEAGLADQILAARVYPREPRSPQG